MADPGSIDDLLSSEIDETAVSALVGSLESQLASPTNKEPPKTISDVSVNNNHIGNASSINVTSTNPSFVVNSTTSAGQKGLTIHNNTAINASFGSASKSNISDSQILGITSIINSSPVPATSGGASQLNVNTVNSKTVNPPHAIRIIQQSPNNTINPSNAAVVHIPSTITGSFPNSVDSGSHTNAPSVHGSNVLTARTDNSVASNAIYNLATIAAEQKPISVAQNGSPHQTIHRGKDLQTFSVKQEPGNLKQENPGSPFVVKQEVKQEPANMQAIHVSVQGTASDGTILPGGSSGNVHLVSNSSVKGTASPSVITVRTPSQPHQQLTVVRPTNVSTAGTNSGPMQIVNVSAANTRPTGGAKGGQVRMSTPVRIAQQPQQITIAPRHQTSTNTITLQPGGFQLQPGTILVKNEQGQLMLMSTSGQGTVPSSQSAVTTVPGAAKQLPVVRPLSTPGRAVSGQTYMTIQQQHGGQNRGQPTVLQQTASGATMTVHNTNLATSAQNTIQVQGAVGQPQPAVTGAPVPGIVSQGQMPQHMMENVKKCKNFLSTLIKLASSQPAETVRNVKELIQGLIDDEVQPEQFTERLQIELKSSPQPYLIPFLKKSLPLLRQCLISKGMTIEGVKQPPPRVLQQPGVMQHMSNTVPGNMHHGVPPIQPGSSSVRPPHPSHIYIRPGTKGPPVSSLPQSVQAMVRNKAGVAPGMGPTPSTVSALQAHVGSNKADAGSSHKEKRKFESLKDDDDINDVATMGGVNLSEESKNILATNAEFIGTQIRSCKDESFLYHGPLLSRIQAIAKKHGVEEIASDVSNIISHATQERLRNISEKLSTIAEHRIEMYKMDPRYEVTTDVKSQLNFLQDLDKLEKKRHEEQEREILLRAIKSRSKNEDPEQMKLKQKAKEFQLQEIEALRQKEANKTALRAIGPRKKQKTDSSDQGQGASTSSSSLSNGLGSSSGRPSMSRPRIKRVNLRDMIFLLEQERSSTKSNILYKAFLK